MSIRLVRDSELPPSPQSPSHDRARLEDLLGSADSRSIANAGMYLANVAQDLHALTSHHAPGGMFHNGRSPGEKSAEATAAWLGELAQHPERASDTREALLQAQAELDRAAMQARRAGLEVDARSARAKEDAYNYLNRQSITRMMIGGEFVTAPPSTASSSKALYIGLAAGAFLVLVGVLLGIHVARR